MSNTSGKAKINSTGSKPRSASEIRRTLVDAASRGRVIGGQQGTHGLAEAAWSRVIGTKKALTGKR
jgi:hypothetical protein